MRFQRLGIVGLGLLCALGAAAAFRNTCGECDGQNINAIGERSTDEDVDDDPIDQAQAALVVSGALDRLSGADDPLTLFGANGDDTTTTTTTTTTPESTTSSSVDPSSTSTSADADADADADESSTTSSTAVLAKAKESTTSAPSTTVVATTQDTTNTTVVESTTSTTASTTTTTAPPATDPPSPPTSYDSNVPVNGSKIYVNPNGGNDSNDGTSESSALKTVKSAFSRVQAGQTVYLMSGEYWEPAPADVHYSLWGKNGRADAWIRVTNAPGHRPVLNANSNTGMLINGDYIEVSGLTIKGSSFSASKNKGSGINIGDAHHVRLIGNTVSGFPMSGMSIVRSSNIHVVNNVVYNNSFWSDRQGSGISFWNSTNHGQGADGSGYHDLIIGNRVFRNENKVNSWKWPANQTDGNGIIIDENRDTGYTGKTLIANNLVYDNGGRGILAYKANNVDIMFNTSYHNARSPQLIGGPVEITTGRSANIRFYHNIAWARSGGPAFIMSNQEMYGPAESKGNIWITNAPHGDENKGSNNKLMNSNPGLRNPTTGSGADFRPDSGSFLNGFAGSGFWAVPNDIVGTGRGGSAEPGAFEAQAGSGR